MNHIYHWMRWKEITSVIREWHFEVLKDEKKGVFLKKKIILSWHKADSFTHFRAIKHRLKWKS